MLFAYLHRKDDRRRFVRIALAWRSHGFERVRVGYSPSSERGGQRKYCGLKVQSARHPCIRVAILALIIS